ncbi:MAG: translocation/assembly module TamB domain-containing protein [Thermodesulfobacteriota bacterium]
MKRVLVIALLFLVPVAVFWALRLPAVDRYLTRKAPAWALAGGVEVRLGEADFDPWGPSLRLSGLEARSAGGEWVFRAESLGVRLRFFKSLSGTLHLEAEAVAPHFEGELRPAPRPPGEARPEPRGLPPVVFEALRVTDGAVALALPDLDLRLELPLVEVAWAENRGTARLAGGGVTWRGEKETLELLAFEGQRRFAAVRVDRLELRTTRLSLEASGRVGPWRLLDLKAAASVSLRELPGAWLDAVGLGKFAPVETAVAVAATIAGTTERPEARGSLRLEAGRFAQVRVDGASAAWTADRGGVSFSALEARSSAVRAAAVEGRLGWEEGIALEARGQAEDYDLRAFMGLLVPGWFPVGVHGSGTFEAKGPLAPELALECRVDARARDLDVTVGPAGGRETVFALPSGSLTSNLTVGAREIRFGATRVESPSAAVVIPTGRLVYAEGLWLDTDVTIRDLEVVRAYVPGGFDARGLAVGSFGGSYDELVFSYDLDLASVKLWGEELGRLRATTRYDLRDLTLESAVVEGPAGRLEGSGTVGLYPEGEYALDVGAAIPEVSTLAGLAGAAGLVLPGGLGGAAWARGRLGGPLAGPWFAGEAGATEVSGGGLQVSRVEARGRGSAASWTLEAGELWAYGAVARVRGEGDRDAFRLEGGVSEVRPEVLAEALGWESPTQGAFAGDVRVEGAYGSPTVSVAGRFPELVLLGRSLGAVEVEARYGNGGVEGEARAFGTGLSVRAELGLSEDLPLAADAVLAALPWGALPSELLPQGLRGESLTGRVQARGALGGSEPALEVSWTGEAAGVSWQDVALERVVVGGHYEPEGLSFSASAWSGEASVTGLASFREGTPLELGVTLRDLRLARFRPLAPVPVGRMTAQGRAVASLDRLRAAQGAAAAVGAVDDLELEGTVTGLVVAGGVLLPEWRFRAESPGGRPRIRVDSQGVMLEAQLEEPARPAWRARVELDRFAPTALLPDDHPLRPLEGLLTARASARGEGGTVGEATASGRIEGLAWAPALPSLWEWSASWDGGRAEFSAQEGRGVALRGGWAPGEALSAVVELEAVPLQGWVAHLAIPEDFGGEADGRGEVRWVPESGVSAGLELSRLRVALEPIALEAPVPVRLAYDRGDVRIESLRLAGNGFGLSASGEFRPGEAWDLDAQATLELDVLRRWVPGVRRSSGTARAELEWRGPWASPRLAGPIAVEPGATLALEALDLPIEDLEASGFFDAEKGFVIEWVDAQVGMGRAHVEGVVGMEGLRPGSLRLLAELRNIAPERPPRVHSLFDADLLLTGTVDRPEIRGDVRLKEFLYEQRVNLKTLIFQALERRPREVRGVPEAGTVFVDVSVRGDDNLRVENNLADLSLAVDLRARGYLPRPVLWGRVEVREGTARLRAVEYEVLRSSVEFLGETRPVPVLDVHVRTTVRQYSVSVDISGPLDDYHVNLSSLPTLPHNDIVALLTLGTTAGEMQDAQALTAAEAASFFTGRLQDELETEVGELLGFDQFSIDPAYSPATQTTVPRVTVGKAITRSLFARYSAAIGGETEQTLEAQYSLTPRVSLLGTWTDRGAQAQGSLGGEIRWRFPFR